MQSMTTTLKDGKLVKVTYMTNNGMVVRYNPCSEKEEILVFFNGDGMIGSKHMEAALKLADWNNTAEVSIHSVEE